MSSDQRYPKPRERLIGPEDPLELRPGETFETAMARLSRELVLRTIDAYDGDRGAAARALGIPLEQLDCEAMGRTGP